jgi:hypothetical protein
MITAFTTNFVYIESHRIFASPWVLVGQKNMCITSIFIAITSLEIFTSKFITTYVETMHVSGKLSVMLEKRKKLHIFTTSALKLKLKIIQTSRLQRLKLVAM